MRIILVEDDKNAKELAGSLRGKGHEVLWTSNVADAEWYINENKDDQSFDAIILDLNLNANFLDISLRSKCHQKSVGWIFYENVLKKINHYLFEHTIFYTGYPDVYRRDYGEKADELRYVFKNDPNASKKIDDLLMELSK